MLANAVGMDSELHTLYGKFYFLFSMPAVEKTPSSGWQFPGKVSEKMSSLASSYKMPDNKTTTILKGNVMYHSSFETKPSKETFANAYLSKCGLQPATSRKGGF